MGGEVVRWAVGRTEGFGGLQCRLDDAGDARRHLVLEVEDIFERAVEAVGPEMRAGFSFDQLHADAHPPTALPDRAFENVADTQLATDALYVDRLAFVGEGRI